MKDIEIKKYVEEKGYLHVRVMFEMLGKPKEHIEETIRKYIDKIKTDPNIEIFKEHFGDARAQEDDLWSTFAEVEMLVKSMDKLTWLSVNFMPASIEIIAPEKKFYTNRELGLWLNDILSRLHEISLMTKSLVSKDKFMSKSLGTLLKNMILLGIGKDSLTPEQIFKKTGIKEEEVITVLEVLEKQGKVKKVGEEYQRIKK